MRFNVKRYKDGQTRVKTFFAWLPVYTEDGEVRWLEKVSVKQKFNYDWLDGQHWFSNIKFL